MLALNTNVRMGKQSRHCFSIRNSYRVGMHVECMWWALDKRARKGETQNTTYHCMNIVWCKMFTCVGLEVILEPWFIIYFFICLSAAYSWGWQGDCADLQFRIFIGRVIIHFIIIVDCHMPDTMRQWHSSMESSEFQTMFSDKVFCDVKPILFNPVEWTKFGIEIGIGTLNNEHIFKYELINL